MTRQERLRSGSHVVHAAVQAQFHVKGSSTPAEWMDLTKVQWMQPDRRPQQRMLICQLVKQSVEIWWPDDEKYYRGTVTEYLPEKVRCDTPVNNDICTVWAPSHPVHISFAQKMASGYLHGSNDAQQHRTCCIMSALTLARVRLSQAAACSKVAAPCCISSGTCTNKAV